MDGVAEEFEAHFVHEKIGGMNDSAGDALAVLAVRGKVSHQSIKGILLSLMHPKSLKWTKKLALRTLSCQTCSQTIVAIISMRDH